MQIPIMKHLQASKMKLGQFNDLKCKYILICQIIFFILVDTCMSTCLIPCSIFSALVVHGWKVGSPVCRVGFGVAVELEHPRKDNTAQLLLNIFHLDNGITFALRLEIMVD